MYGLSVIDVSMCVAVIQEHPAVLPELDLVHEDDQITHLLSLDSEEEYDSEEMLSKYKE